MRSIGACIEVKAALWYDIEISDFVCVNGNYMSIKINDFYEDSTMRNLKQWILDAAQGEDIEYIVIGEMYHERDNEKIPINTILAWNDAEKYIDYDFDSGYGMTGCHPIYAWTKNYIIVIQEYDGSTCCSAVPRHPVDCKPDYL